MYSSEKQTQKEAQDCYSTKHNKRLSSPSQWNRCLAII
jgi:hypothetical protein